MEPTLIMPPPRRRWGRVALFVAGLSVLGCCVAGATAAVVRSAMRSQPGSGADAAGSDGASSPVTPGIGDTVRDGKFEFIVSSVECGQGELVNGILRTRAQGQFCVVQLSVTNIGDEARHFADGAQKAYGPDGDEYAADTGAGVVANGSGAAVWNVINPGNGVQAAIVFDISTDGTITSLVLHDSLLSGGVRVAVAAT